MESLPNYIGLVFGITTMLTVFMFYKATQWSKATLLILVVWLAFQAALGLSGFYKVTDTMPPRFLFLIGLPLLTIIGLFILPKGRQFIDRLNLSDLTLLHVVRIPVELVLFWLFLQATVPQLMTFEGRNFDILSGLSAPIIYYFGFIKKTLSSNIILIWNFICLGLVINIAIHGMLSAPTAFQQFAFEQPNIALLHYPFVWLPSCVVPLVLLSHFASIRQLIKKK